MSGLPKMEERKSFEVFLRERFGLSADVINIVHREQQHKKTSFDSLLVSLGFMDEGLLACALSEFSGLPLSMLEDGDVDKDLFTTHTRDHLLTNNTWLPFQRSGKLLYIALSDPFKKSDIHQAKRSFPFDECVFYVAPPSTIKRVLMRYRREESMPLERLFEQLNNQFGVSSGPLSATDAIPSLLNQLLKEALERGASDIHCEPDARYVRLRLRIDGHLMTHHVFHKDFWDYFCVHLKVTAHMNIAEVRLPQGGRFSRNINGYDVDVRVSTHPTKHGESIVLRLLHRATARHSLETLGFPEALLTTLKNTISLKEGLFVIAGPTGSGKTTTLYALLSYLNTTSRNIMTLEQPIEYDLPYARQTEVPEQSSFTFAQGVRSILRQDPDIIFVGEVRDPETAHMTFRASMTGHQVYTSVHAPHALGIIQRMVDFGVSPSVLAGCLRGLLSQRLVRQLCSYCKQKHTTTSGEQCLLGNREKDRVIYHPEGCEACYQTGYKGRFPLVEFTPCTDALIQLILQGAPLDKLALEAQKSGYRPLYEQGIQAVLEGRTSLAELYSVVSFPHDLVPL